MKSNKMTCYETTTPSGEFDLTVYDNLDDASEALVDHLRFLLDDLTEAECDKGGFKITLSIKPIQMTEKQFKALPEP